MSSQTPSGCLGSANVVQNIMPHQVTGANTPSLTVIVLVHLMCRTYTWLPAGTYQAGDWLMFGAETTGLPQEVCLIHLWHLA